LLPIGFYYFDLEFLKGVQSFKALTGEIYVITNGLRGRQVLYLCSPNSDPNCIKATADFVKRDRLIRSFSGWVTPSFGGFCYWIAELCTKSA
jgi:hypothetical protein